MGGTKGGALGFKPLLVGRDPLDITAILDSIRPYAGPGCQDGGYSAVDIALHDIVGKVLSTGGFFVKEHLRVPAYFDPTPEYEKAQFVGRGSGGPWPHFNVDGGWVNERNSDYCPAYAEPLAPRLGASGAQALLDTYSNTVNRVLPERVK